MKIRPNSTLVMIGDSITECGRELTAREDAPGFLGGGYVYFVHCLTAAAVPPLRLQILNMGVSGDTVRDLEARWEGDVLRRAPDWLSIMIGINDVWREFDPAAPRNQRNPVEDFSGTLQRLIAPIRPQLQGLVLMTPYYLERDRADPIRALMDRFGEEVRRLAVKFQAEFVDTQAAMDVALREYSPAELAADRVHVNEVGQMVLARAFLKAVGYIW